MTDDILTIDKINDIEPLQYSDSYSIEKIDDIEPIEYRTQEKRGLLDSVKYFVGENIKGVARSIELVPPAFEGLLQTGYDQLKNSLQKQLADDGAVFGISEQQYRDRTPLQARRIARNNYVLENLDKSIETSKRLQKNWIEATQTGIEAPSQEFLEASAVPFTDNFQFTKMFALGTQSVPMLGIAAAVTAATKNPTLGASVLGVLEASEEYGIAREKGLSADDARSVFVANAVALSALESVPLTSFMKGGKLPARMFKVASQEGGEEVLQQVWRDSVAKIGYDETRDLTEGLVEAYIGGFISGGVIGAFGPGPRQKRIKSLIEDANKNGVDTDAMIETVAEQVIENADNISESFLEKSPEFMDTEEINRLLDIAGIESQQEVVDGDTKIGQGIQSEEQVVEESGIPTQEQATSKEIIQEEVDWDEYDSITEPKVKPTLEEEKIGAELEIEYDKERKNVVESLKNSIRGNVKSEVGEEFDLIPRSLIAKERGVTLDSLATENESLLNFLGYEASSDGMREFIYNEIGQQGKGRRILRPWPMKSDAKQRLREVNRLIKQRDKRIAQLIRNVEKTLSRKPAPTKTVIKKKTERPKKQIVVDEYNSLKNKIKAESKAARKATSFTKNEIKSSQEDIITAIENSGISAADKSKFIKTIKNIQTATQRDNAIEKINKRIEDVQEKNQKDILQSGIKSILNKTKSVKKGTKNIERFEYEENKFFADLRRINSLKKADALAEVESLNEIETELDMVKKRLLTLKANGRESSVQMYEQVLADINKVVDLASRAKNEKDFMDLLEEVDKQKEFIDSVQKSKYKSKKSFEGKAINLYMRGFGNIWSILNTMAGKKIADTYNLEMPEQNMKTAIDQVDRKITNEAISIYNVNDRVGLFNKFVDYKNDEFSLFGDDGAEVITDRFGIMDIYNSLKNENIKKRYYNYFGEEQVNDLVSELEPEDMLLADRMQEIVQEYRPVFNQRSIEIFGRDAGTVENYWPASSVTDIDYFDDFIVQGNTPKEIKPRSKSMNMKPNPVNAWDKMQRHIHRGEHLRHLTKDHLSLSNLIRKNSVYRSIINKFGDKVYGDFVHLVDTLSFNKYSEGVDVFDEKFGKAINNWVKAKIGLNISSFARQLGSMTNYMEDMPSGTWVKYYKEGLFSPKKTFNLMWKNAPFLEARFNRGYSEALNRALESANGITSKANNWSEAATILTRSGDISAIIYGGYPMVRHELAKKGKTFSTATKKEMSDAIDKFTQASLRSQQSPLRSSGSRFQNSKSSLPRLFLAFENTTTQYLRKGADALISYRNGDISASQYFKILALYNILQPALYAGLGYGSIEFLKGLGRLIRGEEGEDDENKLAKDIMLQIAISPVSALPIIDDLAEYQMRRVMDMPRWGAISTPLFDDIKKAAEKANKKEPDFYDIIDIIATTGEVGTGLPLNNILRYKNYLLGEEKKSSGIKSRKRF